MILVEPWRFSTSRVWRIEFSRPGRKLDALKLEHAEYAGRAALDHHLMSQKSRDPNAAYEDFFRAWMDAVGIPEKEFADISARFREMHTEACMWRIVRDGTHDALARLKSAGFKMGIVSNADGRVAADAKRLGLAEFFDVIIDSQVVGVEKPNPKIFQLALDVLKFLPKRRYTPAISMRSICWVRAPPESRASSSTNTRCIIGSSIPRFATSANFHLLE